MREVSPYKECADKCRKLAVAAKDPEHKRQLSEMAAAWDSIAEQCKSEFAKATDPMP